MIFMINSVFMFISGLAMFSFKRKHMLLMLLSMEFIVLSLYFLMHLFLSMYLYESFFLMFFLTMSVCEGALGLSILVMMIRSYGNDYILTFSLLW
uniref:NADH-ubiquinone oxidoreductase chain 4L n=1 Tax=Cucujoidea sp. 23 KM-2017 TaxID=2219360 RepID=A0A346RI30_9CUCU|nr:NADH dehydrogenase subunit 4L [Cucujoidea sp. 23 KM-2017]